MSLGLSAFAAAVRCSNKGDCTKGDCTKGHRANRHRLPRFSAPSPARSNGGRDKDYQGGHYHPGERCRHQVDGRLDGCAEQGSVASPGGHNARNADQISGRLRAASTGGWDFHMSAGQGVVVGGSAEYVPVIAEFGTYIVVTALHGTPQQVARPPAGPLPRPGQTRQTPRRGPS